jgi:superkiller protein 3
MSFLKQQLKTAKQAITDKNYEYCKSICEQIILTEENYNALVFLGLAEMNLTNYKNSKICYQKAISNCPENILAYQGLLNVLEKSDDDVKLQIQLLQKLELIYIEKYLYFNR